MTEEILMALSSALNVNKRTLSRLGVGLLVATGLAGVTPAGYLLPFAESAWSSDASRVAGGPSFSAEGFHFSLTVGW